MPKRLWHDGEVTNSGEYVESRREAREAVTDYVTRYPAVRSGVADDMGRSGTDDDVIDHVEWFHDLGVDSFVFRLETEDRGGRTERFADEVLPSF